MTHKYIDSVFRYIYVDTFHFIDYNNGVLMDKLWNKESVKINLKDFVFCLTSFREFFEPSEALL